MAAPQRGKVSKSHRLPMGFAGLRIVVADVNNCRIRLNHSSRLTFYLTHIVKACVASTFCWQGCDCGTVCYKINPELLSLEEDQMMDTARKPTNFAAHSSGMSAGKALLGCKDSF